MRKLSFLSLFFIFFLSAYPQFNADLVDSLKTELAKNPGMKERFDLARRLSGLTIYVDLKQSDEYGAELIKIAEQSRDRKLMTDAQYQNGLRYLSLATNTIYNQKAESYFTKALELAKLNKLDKQALSICIGFSTLNRLRSNAESALSYCNQATAFNNHIKDDTLDIDLQLEYGNVYLQRGEKILALRSYLGALTKAEILKLEDKEIEAGNLLSTFYSSIKDYDKAIDYAYKAIRHKKNEQRQDIYVRTVAYYNIGNLYVLKKDHSLAMDFFEKALAAADTMGVSQMKLLIYQGILSAHSSSDNPEKALEFLKENSTLVDFFKSFNLENHLDFLHALVYSKMGNYDSATRYFDKVAPNVMQGIPIMVYYYFSERGAMSKRMGNYTGAIDYFLQASATAEQVKDIALLKNVFSELDTLYQYRGDYKRAHYYADLGFKYKDSLDALSKEKDFLQMEATDEQLRQERLTKEKELAKTQRHNIQYRIILISIICLFIALIMFGLFKVSAGFIKMVAFFAFLMVFEFIFLLLKKQGHSLTEGEPWKDLLLMIGLAAILLPLHHWLEHKAIHWLTSHNRLKVSRKGLGELLSNKKESD